MRTVLKTALACFLAATAAPSAASQGPVKAAKPIARGSPASIPILPGFSPPASAAAPSRADLSAAARSPVQAGLNALESNPALDETRERDPSAAAAALNESFDAAPIKASSIAEIPGPQRASPDDRTRSRRQRRLLRRHSTSHADHYVAEVTTLLRTQSDRLTRDLARFATQGQPMVVDVLGVGAGPHNAMFFATLRLAQPDVRTLVFEATEHMGTFQRMGDSFSVNTKESPSATGNPFRGSPVQIKDLIPGERGYVPASVIGRATVLANHFADSNIVFNQKVTRITETPAGADWPARYRVETSGGLVAFAHQIVVATGLGPPQTKTDDPATAELIQLEAERAHESAQAGDLSDAPGVQTVDNLLEAAQKAARQGADPLAPYRGKRVVVVGQGDGGKIAVEFFGGQAPNLKALKGGLPVRRISWLGQAAATLRQFIDANPGSKRYYETLASIYGGKRLVAVPGRLARLRRVESSSSARSLEVEYRMADGRISTLEGDHVVLATGYKNEVMKLFEGLSGSDPQSLTLEPIIQRVDHLRDQLGPMQVPVGEWLVSNGRVHPIYVIGNASGVSFGNGISDEESSALTGGFLEALGARSEVLARHVAGAVSTTLPPMPRALPQMTLSHMPVRAIPAITTTPMSAAEYQMRMKLLISRLFSPGSSPGKWTVEISPDAGKPIVLRPDSGRTRIVYSHEAGAREIADLQRNCGSFGAEGCQAEILVSEDGQPRLDTLRIEAPKKKRSK